MAQAFGWGVIRYDQRAVSRQGVPAIVAALLVRAGLPVDVGPFFRAETQPGRAVLTLAELASQRGVQPVPGAGAYLVLGSAFGRQLCVQYGTAHIVAVPMEEDPAASPVRSQFVNSGLPEFVRCLCLLGRMWNIRRRLTSGQASRWTAEFQEQLARQDPAAIASPHHWWATVIEWMRNGLI
ncbi:SUKH-4 family immunity protein [Streptomyces violascens]|uniref:SUKH-4 family immunity protein n=1 Tax=Streptomyces violascens TaxID=67381 RepID=UPI00367AB7A3